MSVPAKNYLDAAGYLRDAWRLAAAVRAGGWRPDALLALWRGGAAPAVAVHEFLAAAGWPMVHYPLKCASYTGIGESSGKVVFDDGAGVLPRFTRGMRVLVVDDVFDTGLTVAATLSRLADQGVEARSACVYWKSANNRTALKPDYYVRDPGGEWLVFPHEIAGLSHSEIAVKDPLLARLLEESQTCSPE